MRARAALGAAIAISLFAACAAPVDEAVDSSEDEVVWEPISMALGNPPNFAQVGNGSTMSVVSRGWGRGAKAGALVELYYPHYDADNLWDSYVGVRWRGQKLRWAHDLELKGQRLTKDTGLITSELGDRSVALTIEDVVRPKNDAHVRRVVVKNTSDATLNDVDVAFYAFYTIKNFPDGDRIRFDEAKGALVQTEGDVTIATVADQKPLAAHCGFALNPFGGQRDARMAGEGDDLSPCRETGPSPAGVNGLLVHRLATLAPGESKEISYAIGLGSDAEKALGEAEQALAGGFAARAKEDRAHWKSVLDRAPLPARLPEEARDVYRRAIVTVMQHRVDNGAFIAASTLTSPVYKLVWPRDGSKTAVDMLEAGFAPEAKSFFELLEKLLLPDGSFAVNYRPDASGPFFDFGRDGNEHDQPGMLAWGVDKVFAATKDEAWLAARFPAVRRVAEHLLTITENGVIAPSRDLWELETGKGWTYAQGSAIAGLEAAARSATHLGHAADAARYSARASLLRSELSRFVAPAGYFARGLDDDRVDDRLEIANLALGAGGFGLLPDTDPRLAKVGDSVAQRLLTQGGAVRRYEGDRYYGGQPWPVASVWLALHRLARGDRAGAEALFHVITSQAYATETLMLGEQFDEKKKQWLSAMPLVWSEAAYVRLARALYE